MGRRVRRIATSRQLRAYARGWLKLFGLTDWTVQIDFTRPNSEALEFTDSRGVCYPEVTIKHALIFIQYPRYFESQLDLRQTIVHELLHLFFAALPARSAELQRLTEEQAVDRLATVLVALRR